MSGRLVIMGSGEIAPTMVATHREGLAATAQNRVTVLDTPYGFQENADELSGRIASFFETEIGAEVEVASLRRKGQSPGDVEFFLAAVRRSSFIFAGPGSPTYALGVWEDIGLGPVLMERLRQGATVVMASAAALTVGVATIPVYEIYKVGADPRWEGGLNLTAEFGWEAAIVPHWNNAEGGTHDTSHCYIGSRRYDSLTAELDCGVIGVDEHTAAVIDFGQGTVSVTGVGEVTVEGNGELTVVSGEVVDLSRVVAIVSGSRPVVTVDPGEPVVGVGHLLANGDVRAALNAVLSMEEEVADGRVDLREDLRRAMGEMARLAQAGLGDPRRSVAPIIDEVISWRSEVRDRQDWETADRIRDALAASGIDIRDTPAGTDWDLAPDWDWRDPD